MRSQKPVQPQHSAVPGGLVGLAQQWNSLDILQAGLHDQYLVWFGHHNRHMIHRVHSCQKATNILIQSVLHVFQIILVKQSSVCVARKPAPQLHCSMLNT